MRMIQKIYCCHHPGQNLDQQLFLYLKNSFHIMFWCVSGQYKKTPLVLKGTAGGKPDEMLSLKNNLWCAGSE